MIQLEQILGYILAIGGFIGFVSGIVILQRKTYLRACIIGLLGFCVFTGGLTMAHDANQRQSVVDAKQCQTAAEKLGDSSSYVSYPYNGSPACWVQNKTGTFSRVFNWR